MVPAFERAAMSDSGDSNVTRHETIDERLRTGDLLTDAVFAIVLTLMVLEP